MNKKYNLILFILLALATNVFAQWEKVNSALFGGNYYALAGSGNSIYAGTNFGLFHSNNNGSTWSTIDFGGTDSCVKTILLDGNSMYLGTPAEGVFVSTDAGLTWATRNNGLTNHAVHCFTIMGSSLFVATEGGVFVSDNQGIQWTATNNGISNTNIRALTNLNGVLFAGSDGGGVFVSTNNGQNWMVKNNGLASWYITHLFTHGSKVFIGTDYHMFESSNNGNSWQNAGLDTYAEVLSSTSMNNCIYAGTDGQGVYYSTNGGATWTEWNDGFENKNIYSLAVCGDELFAGVCCGYGLWKRLLLPNTGIEAFNQSLLANVYPNPAQNHLILDFKSVQIVPSDEIVIYDLSGKIVLRQKMECKKTEINISNLKAGSYFSKIKNGERFIYGHFEVIR